MSARRRAAATSVPGVAALGRALERARDAVRRSRTIDRAADVVGDILGVIKPIGWISLLFGLFALLIGMRLHWVELTVVGSAGVILVLLTLPWLVGRAKVRIELLLDPERVIAGQSVAASLTITNVGGSRMRALRLDLPVGNGLFRYDLPSLAAGESHVEDFTIRTERRGVIPVGPATIRRGDPLGIASRDLTWVGVTEIMVRPPMVPLDSLGAGLLRDLEGVTTDAVSHSDLAFHALREYVPGDDLRHVHWRSSAKAMAAGGEGQLLVRQYLDTRRSHVTLVTDDDGSVWGSPDDFETAMSAVASVVVRGLLDDFQATVVVGDRVSAGGDGQLALDTVCRAETGRVGLIDACRTAARVAGDTSLLFLVGGTGTDFTTLRRAASTFGPEVRKLAVVIDPSERSRVTEAGDLPVLHLASRDDLAALLLWSVR
ncbi:DUF58 domain-containing protein [Nocardioides insulae]|uniref:DUF58 domain-containing protein n=1 Tax=Nocardioides insulae TaxID=394734 RepID=UPI0006882929|nr:DUF58 domain-containing protein [Nocardioides insulae]